MGCDTSGEVEELFLSLDEHLEPLGNPALESRDSDHRGSPPPLQREVLPDLDANSGF